MEMEYKERHFPSFCLVKERENMKKESNQMHITIIISYKFKDEKRLRSK